MKRLVLAIVLLALANPVRAQSVPDPNQTARQTAAALSQAQVLVLSIPDMLAQIDALKREISALKAQVKPDETPPAAAK